MSIKLNEWKTRAKDTLASHSFLVFINPPNNMSAGEELQVRTEAISLPGVAFLSVDNFSPYGNGKVYNIPYRYNPQEVSMTHVMDGKADLYKVFRDWSNRIVDLDGTQKYGAKYMKPAGGGYSIDISALVYDRTGKLIKIVKFIEAFPVLVEPIQLNWAQNDEIMKLNVQYRFTRFEITSY